MVYKLRGRIAKPSPRIVFFLLQVTCGAPYRSEHHKKRYLNYINYYYYYYNLMYLPIEKWDSDISFSYDFNIWTQICKNTFSMINNSNLQLIQYKILHTYYFLSTYYTIQKNIKWALPTHPSVFNVIRDGQYFKYMYLKYVFEIQNTILYIVFKYL